MKILGNSMAYLGTAVFIFVIMKAVFADGLTNISPSEANDAVKAGKAIILDVREVDEIMQGKIKGAKELPLSIMSNDKTRFDKEVELLPKEKEVYVYCRSGRRSGIVGGVLKNKGFNVKNLGGFSAWESAGLPVEKMSCFATKC